MLARAEDSLSVCPRRDAGPAPEEKDGDILCLRYYSLRMGRKHAMHAVCGEVTAPRALELRRLQQKHLPFD